MCYLRTGRFLNPPLDSHRVLSHILIVRERLEEMSELVSENLKGAQKRQKLWYDQNARERVLEPEDAILVLLPTTSSKLLAQWQGPYHVLCRVGEVNYEVYMPDKRKRRAILHINMLKWHQPETMCFWTVGIDPDEEEVVPTWRGEESGRSPSVGIQLTVQQKRQLLELLSDFKSVMSDRCGRTSICQHNI